MPYFAALELQGIGEGLFMSPHEAGKLLRVVLIDGD